jgi:hypothetical protein
MKAERGEHDARDPEGQHSISDFFCRSHGVITPGRGFKFSWTFSEFPPQISNNA